jgi:hypothetical protein
VHHAEILSLKGDSYRLKDRDLGRVTPNETDPHGADDSIHAVAEVSCQPAKTSPRRPERKPSSTFWLVYGREGRRALRSAECVPSPALCSPTWR